MVKLLFSVFLMMTAIDAHSWLACTDYTEKNGAYWAPEKCRGFPRDAANYAPKQSFGLDRGFDHKPGQNGKACKTTFSGSSYSDVYPKAVYYPGQQVILVHPMKNHGADVCTNKHIPDFGNRIYRGRPGRDRDEIYSFYKNMLVSDLGISRTGSALANPSVYPKPGYQNAPAFCENTDTAMGTYSFNVPSDLVEGEYTFVWRWSFNGPSDIYTTCFDVEIVADKAERDAILTTRGVRDLSVSCGGVLSNEQPGSTEGCYDKSTPKPKPELPQQPAPPKPELTQEPVPPKPELTQQPAPTLKPKPELTQEPAPKGKNRRQMKAKITAHQMSGTIYLPGVTKTVNWREIRVRFACKQVKAHFWMKSQQSSKVVGDEIVFTVYQVDSWDIMGRKLLYSFNLDPDDDCDALAYPVIESVDDYSD